MRRYIELGVYKASIFFGGHHGSVVLTHGPSVEIAAEANPIWGLKYGAWISGGFPAALSLNVVYYTDFEYGNFKIRPEFGFGVGFLKAVVGYNIPTFWNKDFKRLRRADLQLSLCAIPFKLKTISIEK